MSNFTYELPDEVMFFQAILSVLKNDRNYSANNAYDIFKDGYCEISASSSYSQKRWNAMYTSVNFYIPQDKYGKNANVIQSLKSSLKKVCEEVMPPNAGYDVMEIHISPSLKISSEDPLNEIITTANLSKLNILSEEIKNKGIEMSELYASLYCIENSLRVFIDKIFMESFGEDYFEKATIPNDVKNGIIIRKKEESQYKWLPLRGDKFIYYLDFIDLAKLIVNNWQKFNMYFPDQGWISIKMAELYKVRCLIAHNSYVGEDEKSMVSLYYKQIVKQISQIE